MLSEFSCRRFNIQLPAMFSKWLTHVLQQAVALLWEPSPPKATYLKNKTKYCSAPGIYASENEQNHQHILQQLRENKKSPPEQPTPTSKKATRAPSKVFFHSKHQVKRLLFRILFWIWGHGLAHCATTPLLALSSS